MIPISLFVVLALAIPPFSDPADKTMKHLLLSVQTDKDDLLPGEWVRVGIWADTNPAKGQQLAVDIQGKAYQAIVSHYMLSVCDLHVETNGPMLSWPWANFQFHPLMNYNAQTPEFSQYGIDGIACSQLWSMYAYGKVDKNLPIEICSFYWQAPSVWQPYTYDFVIKGKASPGYLNGSIACTIPVLGKDYVVPYWSMIHSHKSVTVQPEGWCAPDCDGSGSVDINDFACFQTLFAIGDPKADCDGDGQLLIDDFICFQTAYAIGC